MRAHNTNTLAATGQLLKHAGVIYSQQHLKDDLLGHPDYPSLFAVHHVLNQYGVPNSPVEVDAENLDRLGQPFLAYMQLPGSGNDFAAVNRVQHGSISYTNAEGKEETISREDFLTRWKNIAIMLNGSAPIKTGAQPPTSQTKPFGMGFSGLFLLFLIVVIATFNTGNAFVFMPWLLLKMGGLALTVLLLMYEADKRNETVKQFCNAGKTVSCDAVLQSKGAKLGGLNWSELGFAYFAGTFLYLLFFNNAGVTYLLLAALSLAVFPYTIYSVYYQYKIVKQWCRLCLFVQGIIAAEALLAAFIILPHANWQQLTADLPTALMLLPLMVLPLLGWLLLKPAFQKAAVADSYRYAYLRQQNNPEVFHAMLQRQAAAPNGFQDCGLLIGNPNASQYIIKICNPFCGPCASAHPILENIVEEHDVKMYLLFTATNSVDDKRGIVAKHFIALYQSKGQQAAKEAMHWWYGNNEKTLEKLVELFPVSTENVENITNILEQMQGWNNEADIRFTPTVYVNGHRLPEAYTVKQLEKMYGYE